MEGGEKHNFSTTLKKPAYFSNIHSILIPIFEHAVFKKMFFLMMNFGDDLK